MFVKREHLNLKFRKEANKMRIQHNIMAMNAYRNYNNNTSSLSGNLEKLSSGYKINRAGDDAAGLAISEKMRAQISGLEQASSNVKDGISLVKTGEGALQEVQDMLNRMVTLATQSANGTYDDAVDRTNLQKEVTALKSEIDRIADSANFNGIQLLDGTQSKGVTTVTDWGTGTAAASIKLDFTGVTGKDIIGGKISIGNKTFTVAAGSTTAGAWDGTTLKVTKSTTANDIVTRLGEKIADITAKDTSGNALKMSKSATGTTITYTATKTGKAIEATSLPELKISAGLNLQIGDTAMTYNQMNVGIGDMHTKNLFIDDIDISSQEGATTAVSKIKNAINMVSSTRGDLGAIQNRLEHTANNLSVMTENIQDAESTIRDTDIAEEMMSYTKNNILVQSAQAMLAQANTVPQGVLQLLQ
jgi:flagellin